MQRNKSLFLALLHTQTSWILLCSIDVRYNSTLNNLGGTFQRLPLLCLIIKGKDKTERHAVFISPGVCWHLSYFFFFLFCTRCFPDMLNLPSLVIMYMP